MPGRDSNHAVTTGDSTIHGYKHKDKHWENTNTNTEKRQTHRNKATRKSTLDVMVWIQSWSNIWQMDKVYSQYRTPHNYELLMFLPNRPSELTICTVGGFYSWVQIQCMAWGDSNHAVSGKKFAKAATRISNTDPRRKSTHTIRVTLAEVREGSVDCCSLLLQQD